MGTRDPGATDKIAPQPSVKSRPAISGFGRPERSSQPINTPATRSDRRKGAGGPSPSVVPAQVAPEQQPVQPGGEIVIG